MIYKTYEEWQRLGYQVEKGQKSHKRNKAGIAVFSEEQVLDQDECGYDAFYGYGHEDWGDRS